MKSEKQVSLDLIDRMPDEVSSETIITELQFRLTMLRRGEDAERGENLISHEEATKPIEVADLSWHVEAATDLDACAAFIERAAGGPLLATRSARGRTAARSAADGSSRPGDR